MEVNDPGAFISRHFVKTLCETKRSRDITREHTAFPCDIIFIIWDIILEKGSNPPGVAGFVVGPDPAVAAVVVAVVLVVVVSVELGFADVAVVVVVAVVTKEVVLVPLNPGGIVILAPGKPILKW